MDGIHDMGGMAGFGPVDVSAEASGHEGWEARIQATALLSGGMSRPGIEAIPPAEYLSSGYAEKWLVCAEQRLLGDGVIDQDRLNHWRSEFSSDPTRMPPRDDAPERVAGLVEGLNTTPSLSDAPSPRFVVGERVRVRRMRPDGHNRCPRYAWLAAGPTRPVGRRLQPHSREQRVARQVEPGWNRGLPAVERGRRPRTGTALPRGDIDDRTVPRWRCHRLPW
jgi:nitrile hydratase